LVGPTLACIRWKGRVLEKHHSKHRSRCNEGADEAQQCAAKIHDLHWGDWRDGFVEITVDKIVNQAVTSAFLRNCIHWGHPEVGQVPHGL